MNLSAYFVVAVIAVSVVFAHQSDEKNLANETISVIRNSSKVNLDANIFPNATIFAENAFIDSTKRAAESEGMIKNAFLKAKDLLPQDAEGAKKLLYKSFEDSRVVLFQCAVPTTVSYGAVLEFSNNGARQGLNNAFISLQRAGFSAINAVIAAKFLLNQVMAGRGIANQVLLKACQLAIETGYAGFYNNYQIAIQEADQAIRDAQSKPTQGEIENQTCESEEHSPETQDAIKDIIEAANNATENGANADLVQELKDSLISSLCEYVNTTILDTHTARNISTGAETNPAETSNAYSKIFDDFTTKVLSIFSKIVGAIGTAAFKSGNLTNAAISAAVVAVVEGDVEVVLGIETGKDIIDVGMKYGGDAPQLAFEAAVEIGTFAQIAVCQTVVKCAKLAFSAL